MAEILESLEPGERLAVYLWALSCAMDCVYTEMEDIYTTWYGGETFYRGLSKLSDKLGGLSCNIEVEGGIALHYFIITTLWPMLPKKADVSIRALYALEFLEKSGLAEEMSRREEMMTSNVKKLSLGKAIPMGQLEHCLMYYLRAVHGDNISLSEAHAIILELIRSGYLVRCSKSGQDIFYMEKIHYQTYLNTEKVER
ncbi:hypothetical protein [Pyrobaculum aerophilum]|uniref:hypothetical protein n=1 Tax=Pyrobaculum aerophilum TaxID=13773 RepID=UPI0011D172D3|nr:hypothetical protein [Pyrobaculum aerophilum]